MIQYVVLRHIYYEYHYSPQLLAFQNIMWAGDQKLMINLEWPNSLLTCSIWFLVFTKCVPTDDTMS